MAPPQDPSADELMSAYLDRELDEAASAAFEAELATSKAARDELAALQQVLRLVQTLPEVEAPPDFYDKIAKKLRRRRLLEGDLPVFVTLPFQVLSVIVVLAIAVVYTMLHLDRDPAAKLERDPEAAATAADEGAPPETADLPADLPPGTAIN